MTRWLFWCVLGLLYVGLALPALGQYDEEDEEEPFRPGLVAAYKDAGGSSLERIDETIAFDWGAATPDARLSSGPFSATWRGELVLQSSGNYRFFLYGAGEVELKVGGKVVIPRTRVREQWIASETLELPSDNQPLELSFRQTGENARIALFWLGPQFEREPLPARYLVHDRTKSPDGRFERGQALARALRCEACHAADSDANVAAAPSLAYLSGNVQPEWVAAWLRGETAPPKVSDEEESRPQMQRRMPHFGFSQEDAELLTDWLLAAPPQAASVKPASKPVAKQPAPAKKQAAVKKQASKGKKAPAKAPPSAAAGEQIFVTMGCLACHQLGDLGESGLFGGGDLTAIADKRPAEFFSAWLADPAKLNPDHRMPIFDLTADQRQSLALLLGEQASAAKQESGRVQTRVQKLSAEQADRARQLVADAGCARCHQLPQHAVAAATTAKTLPPAAKPLTKASNWQESCGGEPVAASHQPGYRLSADDQAALKTYFTARADVNGGKLAELDGRWLMVEQNCLACHSREGLTTLRGILPATLATKLTAVADEYDDLATHVAALTPPSLNSVGDKLHEEALAETIRRQGPPHRPYLSVRMPKFRLSDEQLRAVIDYLVATDRIPHDPQAPVHPAPDTARLAALTTAGGRLVSTDGFGCTSCHTVAAIDPPNAPPNARGPELAQMQRRLRREWFDRWVRNPARIVPRMEMPSVQLPVRGVLGDNIHEQLHAVWHVLNMPGFKPPEPNPVRVLRRTGVPAQKEQAIALTDVLQEGAEPMIRPFFVGLPNRHNVLIDLESGRFTQWRMGDLARQRTKGKSWFWEAAGVPLVQASETRPDLALIASGKTIEPLRQGQFMTSEHAWSYGTESQPDALRLTYRLRFPGASDSAADDVRLIAERTFAPRWAGKDRLTGFSQTLVVRGVPAGNNVQLRLFDASEVKEARWSDDRRSVRLKRPYLAEVRLVEPSAGRFDADGTLTLVRNDAGEARVQVEFVTDLPSDQYLIETPSFSVAADPLEIAPGFSAVRLPLRDDILPTGLAWKPDGTLVLASLKGEVAEAHDTDSDGLEDQLKTLLDGLPAPYGVATGEGYVDVSAKTAVLRISAGEGKSRSRVETVAAGWGYTSDYHDWTVGLVRDERDGSYYVGIPCQQDKRNAIEATHRGTVLRLVPRTPTADDSTRYKIEVVSRGHRFPMGLAQQTDGAVFVTDNQGNYNPFNELNHVRPGAHFGFINAIERSTTQERPPVTPPAIDIPHPWTRSVNGIAFLNTPAKLRERLGRDAFGPLEGQLVGCEYDTRRLVRMSLEKVGDTYQGAAYPLSLPPDENGMLGPVVCAVSPRGELYVGSIRESGWGAGNNIGEVVRVTLDPAKLPGGIAEMTATKDGFHVKFFRPVDAAKGADAAQYALVSYRREATPAYGGPDLEHRTEKVVGVKLNDDRTEATIQLESLRPGFVYELRMQNIAPQSETFYPAEAFYTLRRVPE